MKPKLGRREFWDTFAFGSFWTAIGTAVLGMVKLPKPGVMPEASSRVKLGRPHAWPPGVALALADKNLFVFGDAEGVYAISAVCTHLGCIVNRTAEGRFECHCHGSRFDAEGRPRAGPAPRGLDWLEVRQAPNGVLYADTSRPVPPGTKWRRV